MIRFGLIFLLFFIPVTQASEPESFEIDAPLDEPLLGLYQFLLDQDEISIQLALPIHSIKGILKTDKRKFKKVLSKAISIKSSPFVLYQANIICHSYLELTEFCHQKNIHSIHKEVDPENIYTYLFNLHKDTERKNQKTIQQASISQFAQSYIHENTLELALYIKQYYEINPDLLTIEPREEGNSYEESVLLYIEQLANKGLADKDELTKLLTNNDPETLSLTLGLVMANIYPRFFSTLHKACNDPLIYNECIDIGNLLLKDKSILSQSQGYQILKNIYQETQPELALQLKKKQDFEFKKMRCYANWKDAMFAAIINPRLSKTFIENFKSNGELAAFKSLAIEVYDIEKRHGYNPDFNPNDCE